MITRAFLVPIAVLIVAELVCRTFYADGFTGRFDYGYLPSAGFVAKDGGVELRRTGGRKFYPQSFATPKPAGRVRIFTIGDSVTRGEDLETAYPRQLETVLRQRGYDVESLNLGVTAYGGTRKRLVTLETLRYQPDLIVLHVSEANEGYDERDWQRAESYRSWHPRNWFLKSYALHRLYEMRTDRLFWKYLPPEIQTLRSVQTPDAALAAAWGDPARLAQWNRRTRERTEDTVRAVVAAGVPMILISAAYHDRAHPDLTDDGLSAFAEGLTGPQVRHVSILKLFRGRPVAENFTDSMHLTVSAHREMAEALAREAEALLKR